MTPDRRRVTLLAAAALAIAVGPTAVEAEPRQGGTLTYTFDPEPAAFSTIATTAVPVALISTMIFESLIEYEGAEMAPRPGLAESWEVSDDQLTYTFHLRDDVRWHDGEPFTSADVKFSIEEAIRPLHSRGRVYFGNVETIETPDDHTVVFHLSAPVPYLLRAFQPTEAPMLPKHLLDTDEVRALASMREARVLREEPVGTGPFRLGEWSRGSHIILERNEDYWKEGKPYLDRIVLRIIPDGAARAIAVERGDVDLAPMSALPPPEIARVGAMDGIVLSTEGSEALGPIMWLEVNMREEPLSDRRVRQAISLGLDRERLVDIIWYGLGKPAAGPVVSGNPVHFDPELEPLPYDPERAEALLDEAGYPRGPDGVRFTLRQNYLPYGESWVRQAEFIRHELGQIGIAIETESLDFGGWLRKIYTDWDYHFTSNFTHNYSDPTIGVERAYASWNIQQGASFTNSMNYVNEEVDALFEQARAMPDGAERNELWYRLQGILREDLPVIWLIEMAHTHLWHDNVHGILNNGIALYSNWDEVWID